MTPILITWECAWKPGNVLGNLGMRLETWECVWKPGNAFGNLGMMAIV